jgi:CDGSH-type Zn-finger protein
LSVSDDQPATGKKQIVIRPNGPYIVRGNVPLVHKTQVVSEFGEPLTWKKDGGIEVEAEEYRLCRCGQSGKKPFCDDTHLKIDFDGSERAKTDASAGFQMTFRGTRLIVKNDLSICMNSGYCKLRDTNLFEIIAAADNTERRSLAIAMIEHCPSGALTYTMEEGGVDIEPDLPQQIADTTEITANGPIRGPLWVTGYIEILRSDGQYFEPRNRVTLCNCGRSKNKPLCDGGHRFEMEQKDGEETAAQ